MKKNLFLIALLGMVVSMSACKDDEGDGDGNPTVEDSFTYNNQTYDMNSGAILDYGPISLTEEEDTHYAYAFLLSDGTMSFPEDEDPTLTQATYVLTTFLYSKNTSSFSGGTFEWVNPATATEDDILGKDVMMFAMLTVDSNNDGDVEDDGDLDYTATDGSIVVEGSGSNYSLTFDLDFNGKRLQGNYEGPFTIVQAPEDPDQGESNGEGAFMYLEETYAANFGLIEDFGAGDLDQDGTEDYYNYDFYLTDGVYTIEDGEFYLDGDYQFEVAAELFSPSPTGFETGTFEFVPNYEVSSLDQFFFSAAYVSVDLNGDGDMDDANEFALATGGFITVDGDESEQSIIFNLELDNGETLQGGFEGDFAFFDSSEGERRGAANNAKTRPGLKHANEKLRLTNR